jgi:hypothetical protein
MKEFVATKERPSQPLCGPLNEALAKATVFAGFALKYIEAANFRVRVSTP